MATGDKQIYQWSVGDVRKLDRTLSKIQDDISSLRNTLPSSKPSVVVDNSRNWDPKAMALLIGSIIAMVLLAVQEARK